MAEKIRCPWSLKDEIYQQYHDEEWGIPHHDDTHLFEMLNLEGAQAGLSWYTVLVKRPYYRKAFDGWDAKKIARYTDQKVEKLLQNEKIIRNRLKIRATISNARAFLETQSQFGTFDRFIWQFVDGKQIVNHWKNIREVPPKTPVSDKMSRELLQRGFKFVGSTICYAYMQAVGMVNDHLVDCWRYKTKK